MKLALCILTLTLAGCAKKAYTPPVVDATLPPQVAATPAPEIQRDQSFTFADVCDPRLTALHVALNAQQVDTPCVEH